MLVCVVMPHMAQVDAVADCSNPKPYWIDIIGWLSTSFLSALQQKRLLAKFRQVNCVVFG